MLRASVCSVAILALLCVSFVAAADQKAKDTDKDHQRMKATITKVDAKHGTITVKMKDEHGKDVEKTFRLAEDIEYLDSTGEAARIDIFQSGDDVLVLEKEGKIKELWKDHSNKPEHNEHKGSGGK